MVLLWTLGCMYPFKLVFVFSRCMPKSGTVRSWWWIMLSTVFHSEYTNLHFLEGCKRGFLFSTHSSTFIVCIYQFSSIAQLCPTLCDPMDCSMPGLPVPHQHPECTQTHVHWVGDAIQPSHPLSSPSPSIFPSIRVFSDELVLHIRYSNYWSFSFSISPSNE